MKIKSVFFIAIFVLLTSQVFAKENDIEIPVQTHLSTEKQDSREELVPFNFQKIFAEAEAYFKAAKAWKKLKCQPKSGFICTKHECKKREIKSYVILDKKAETITRCDKSDCQSFPAEFNQTGVFFNVQTEGPIGTLIRVLGDSRYKEITTVALDAYIANGECKVVE